MSGFSRGVNRGGARAARRPLSRSPTTCCRSTNQRLLRSRCIDAEDPSSIHGRHLAGRQLVRREAFDLFGILFAGHRICVASSPTTDSSAIRSARTSR
jgi:hypothetical protein